MTMIDAKVTNICSHRYGMFIKSEWHDISDPDYVPWFLILCRFVEIYESANQPDHMFSRYHELVVTRDGESYYQYPSCSRYSDKKFEKREQSIIQVAIKHYVMEL